MPRLFLTVTACLVGFLLQHSTADAQGLLWSIPSEEGAYVRYFGDMKQVEERPDSARGPLETTWQTELTIKALGTEEAIYKSKKTLCRWLEFKNVIGHQSATGIDAGPYGVRFYKVLVPESAIVGKILDDRNLPVILVPVVKGFQKSGNKPVQPVAENVLTFYPLLGLFAYYPSLTPVGDQAETISLPQLGDVAARHYSGVETLQSSTSRSVNEGEIWITDDIPFGWANYKAKIVREQKDRLAPIEAFKKQTEIVISMSAVEKGSGARSELLVAEDGTEQVDSPSTGENRGTEPTPANGTAADNPTGEKSSDGESSENAEPSETPEGSEPAK